MTTDIQSFHAFWIGLFAALGIVLLVKSPSFSRIIAKFDDLDFETTSDRERVMSAARRRQEMEQASWWKAALPGALALLYAVLSAFTAPEEQAMLWAFFCLGAAAIFAGVYLKIRSRNPVRVASLNARSPLGVIPPVWFGVASAVALSTLLGIDRPNMTAPSIATCLASFACIALAWRAAGVRAILTGEDVPAEQFVDERLRFIRATGILVFALVQSELFLVLFDPHWDTSGGAAKVAAMLALLGYIVWTKGRHAKGPSELPA